MYQNIFLQQKFKIIELTVKINRVLLSVLIPPKVSVSKFMGIVKKDVQRFVF